MIGRFPSGRPPEAAPPSRGYHIAAIGLERLEAILYERDELRERLARYDTCGACRDGDHDCCLRTEVREALAGVGLALTTPPCACTDCALGIPEAAQDPIPGDVWNEVVAGLPAGGGR